MPSEDDRERPTASSTADAVVEKLLAELDGVADRTWEAANGSFDILQHALEILLQRLPEDVDHTGRDPALHAAFTVVSQLLPRTSTSPP